MTIPFFHRRVAVQNNRHGQQSADGYLYRTQNRVTDHRINLTLYKLDAIMQGDLNEIVEALCIAARKQMMKAQS